MSRRYRKDIPPSPNEKRFRNIALPPPTMTRTPTKTEGFIIYNRLPLAGLPSIARMGGKEPRVRHKNPQWADDYPYNRGFLCRTCEKEHYAVMNHRSPSYLMVSVNHVSVLYLSPRLGEGKSALVRYKATCTQTIPQTRVSERLSGYLW